MVAVVLAILVATGAGIGAERRWGDGARALTGRLIAALLYVVLPLITFFVIARLHLTAGVAVGILYGYLAAVGAGALGYLIGTRWLALPAPGAGALAVSAIQGNTGYLGLPLTAALLGSHQLGAAIAYDILVSTTLLYLASFGVGAVLGTRAGTGARARTTAYLTRNPVLAAMALALVVPDALAPDVAVEVAKAAALALLPIGFFVLGVHLMHEREDGVLDFPPSMSPALLTALGLRLAVAPLVMLALSALLVRAPDAYLLQAAMPTGINTLIVAHVYGLDLRLTAAAVAWSTAIVVVVAVVAAVLA